MITSVFSSWL